MSKYDAILNEEMNAAPKKGSSVYDAVLDQEVQLNRQRARAVFESALSANPDHAAESKKLMNTTGLPLAVVERNLEELRRKEQARMLDLARMAEDSPVLSRQLLDPTFTKQAHDDISNLGEIERTILGTAKDVGVTALKGAVGLPQAIVGLADIPTFGYAGKAVQALGVDFARTQRILSGDEGETLISYSLAQQQANKNVEIADGFLNTLSAMLQNPSTIATTVGETLPQLLGGAAAARKILQVGGKSVAAGEFGPQLPSLLVRQFGEKTATVLAGAFGEGLMAAGSAAETMRAENADGLLGVKQVIASLGLGAGTAIFGMGGGRIAQKIGLDDIDTVLASRGLSTEAADQAKQGFVSAVIKSGISESLFEELPQSVQEQMWQNWANDKPLDEGVGKAAAQGMVAGFAMGGGFQAINRAVQRAADIDQSETNAKLLQSAQELAAASKLRERNPDEFRSLVQQMADQTEGAPTEIYVDGDVLNQLAPEALAQLPQAVRDQIPQAAAIGDVVAIPMGDVLTVAPGTVLEQALVDNARIGDPRAMTRKEAQEAGAQAQEFLAQEAQRVMQQAQDQAAVEAEFAAVRDDLKTQIAATQRYSESVSDAYATGLTHFFVAYGSRTGMGTQGLYQAYRDRGFRISGQPTAQAQGQVLNDIAVLDQGDVTVTDQVDEVTGLPLNADGTVTLYHHTSAANAEKIRQSQALKSAGEPSVYLTTRAETDTGYGDTAVKVRINPELLQLDDEFPDGRRDFSVDVRRPGGVLRDAEFEQRGVQAKGKEIAPTVDQVSNVEASFEFAGSQQFPNNRDFKLAIQSRVLAAAKAAKVKLDEFTQGVERYLTRMAVTDGITALRTNANAVGWYNEKVTKALRLVSLIHPEIATDPQAKFAFVWAMAVTSNGLKVDKNFELAEKVYQGYKTTGQMPTDIGIGTAAEAINRSLGLYNTLIAKHGFDAVERFMTTMQSAGEVEKFTGQKVTGENKTTMVYGAAALGPKIGNGFFMNLYGRFEQLTMDRWLMRTWGRWTATLVESNPAQVKAKRTSLKALIQSLTPADKKAFEAIIKRKLTVGDIDAVGQAIWKASQKPANRVAMAKVGAVDEAGQAKLTEILGEPKKDQARVSIGDELRKGGNALTKYLDGQKEAPAGPPERGNIRKVFSAALAELQKQHPALTMSDFQALLWYPEKRLYDAAKTSEEAADAYEDDEAPDYANAAAKLARAQGIPDSDIAAAIAAVDAELQAAVSSGGARPGERGTGPADGTLSQAEGVTPPSANVLEQGPLGTFNPRSLELVLNPDANLSTLWHEMGHFFLEVMADISSQPDAPAQISADFDTFLKWAGTDRAQWAAWQAEYKQTGKINPDLVAIHERWAESIEQYIMEGKVPNAEMQPLMRRFSAWLLDVYKSIKKFLTDRGQTGTSPMALNDDIRRVMDRMLATDEQIQQANEAAGMAPNVEADAEANERLNKRSMADLKWTVKARDKAIKKLQAEAASIRKEIEEQVTLEVNQMPEVLAKEKLDALTIVPEHKVLLDQYKVDRQAAIDAAQTEITDLMVAEQEAKEGTLKGLAKGQFLAKSKREIANRVDARMIEWDRANPRPMRPVNVTDMDMAIIADSYEFADVPTMLQAIDAFGNKRDVIEGMTEQRMLEENGDLIDPRAIEQAANEAVHNEARARSLASELRTQQEMLNPRTDTGQVNAAGSKITVNALVEAAKQFGANVVARTPLKDLRSLSAKHTAAERRAAKRWQEATAKGDTQAAVKAKQDQMLNNAAAKAAIDALEEAKKITEFFKRVVKGNNEKVVEKGRDPDIVNAARAVLAAYGVETPTTKAAADYLETLQRNDPQTYAAIEPMVAGMMSNAQPLQALTFQELQALGEEVNAMWHLAKRSRQMEVDGDLLDVEDVADEVYARMEEIGIPDTVPGETGALTKAEERSRMLQFAGALLRRVEQWAEAKDGKFGGPFLRFIFQPVKDAADRYRADRVVYRKKFQALVDNIAPMMRPGLVEAPELGYTFGRGHNGIGMAELLHAILHTGNGSNKRKLLLGRGWATENADGTLDTSRWDAFIKRLTDTGVLTKAHYDFAQGVWDLMEETKPLAQKTHRDVFGRYFEEITAESFDTPFGTYRGGYVPAQADPLLVQDAELRDLLEGENESMSYSFPSTNRGFTKGRVEYNRPLKLDLRSLPQHLDKVLLFSHMEPAVRGVAKLIKQPKVSQPLGRIDPGAISGLLRPWLNRSARQVVETPVLGDGRISRMASIVRARAGMTLMFANLSNTIQQITGLSTAAVKVKPAHLMRAVANYIANPRKASRAVWDASPYMDDRASNEVAAMNDVIDQILLDPSMLERGQAWTQRHGYFLQTAFDNILSPIIWTGAYNQAVEEGMEERMAIRFADGVVRQTQGSTLPEDVSRFETGPAYARLFTQFVGYFNMMANTNATALKQITGEMGLRKGAGKALYVVTMGLLMPIWVAEAIAQAFRGGPEDEDDDGYLDDWLASVFGFGTIKGIFAQVPIVGQVSQGVVSRFNDNPADDKFSLSPAVSLIESAAGSPASVYKAIVEDGPKQKAVRDVAALVTMATGIPVYAAARPVGYAAGVADDRIEPTGPVDLTRGLVTGTASPESKQR